MSNKPAKAAKSTETNSDICDIEFVDSVKVLNVAGAMRPDSAITLLAETFKVLGDPTRLRIAFALSCEELCVCDLANLLGVSQSAVSHSLRVLRQMKLVKFRKVGKIAYYTSDDEHIGLLLAEGFRHVEELV